MDIKIRKLHPNGIDKFTGLIRVFEDVFEMKDFKMPDEIYLQQLLEKDDFLVFAALLNNKVVAA